MGPSALEVQSGGGRGRWDRVEPIDPELLNRALAALGERGSAAISTLAVATDTLAAGLGDAGRRYGDVEDRLAVIGRRVIG